jgi:hypothetical protein
MWLLSVHVMSSGWLYVAHPMRQHMWLNHVVSKWVIQYRGRIIPYPWLYLLVWPIKIIGYSTWRIGYVPASYPERTRIGRVSDTYSADFKKYESNKLLNKFIIKLKNEKTFKNIFSIFIDLLWFKFITEVERATLLPKISPIASRIESFFYWLKSRFWCQISYILQF